MANEIRNSTVLKSVSKLRTFEKIYVVPILEETEWWSQDHMGCLRIMCPGSVIGEQRRYLCALERPLACVQPPPLLRSQSAVARPAPQPLVDFSSRRGSVGSRPPTAAASAGKLAPAASAASAAASTRKIAPAAAGSAELARQVAEAMTRRAASRIRAGR